MCLVDFSVITPLFFPFDFINVDPAISLHFELTDGVLISPMSTYHSEIFDVYIVEPARFFILLCFFGHKAFETEVGPLDRLFIVLSSDHVLRVT